MAACCSKRNCSRMLLLVSTRTARRSGRSDSAVNCWMICGFLFSMTSKSVFAEIGDEAAFLIRDGEQNVDARDIENDARRIVGFARGAGCLDFLWRSGILGHKHGRQRQKHTQGARAEQFHMAIILSPGDLHWHTSCYRLLAISVADKKCCPAEEEILGMCNYKPCVRWRLCCG